MRVRRSWRCAREKQQEKKKEKKREKQQEMKLAMREKQAMRA